MYVALLVCMPPACVRSGHGLLLHVPAPARLLGHGREGQWAMESAIVGPVSDATWGYPVPVGLLFFCRSLPFVYNICICVFFIAAKRRFLVVGMAVTKSGQLNFAERMISRIRRVGVVSCLKSLPRSGKSFPHRSASIESCWQVGRALVAVERSFSLNILPAFGHSHYLLTYVRARLSPHSQQMNQTTMASSASGRSNPTASASAAAPLSVLLPDGRLNTDHLRKEVASDVSLDDRYRAEDAMKKRAIHSCECCIILLFGNCPACFDASPIIRTYSHTVTSPLIIHSFLSS